MRDRAPAPSPSEMLLLDDAPILGGAELFALRLARFAAAERDLRIRIVCPAGSELAERCDALGVPWTGHEYPSMGPDGVPHWPGAIARTRTLLAKAGPGVIVIANTARAQAYVTAAAPLLARRRRPALVHVLHEQDTLQRHSARLVLGRRLAALVPIGENVAATAREALPDVQLWKANNFLDPAGFAPLERAQTESGGRPVLGVLARLIPEKGVLEMIDELAGSQAWDRVVVGGPRQDPDYARALEQRIAELGLEPRITLAGQIDDVPAFLGSIDALVIPSTGNEAQPTVILEGLAAGLTCLVRSAVYSSDFEGLPVLPYANPAEFDARLGELPLDAAPADEVRRRFGPEQALDAIFAAAGRQS